MSRRAQTTLDFALGVSLFAAVLLFVFVFVPGILTPFTGGLHEETVTSNRVADGVVNGQFGTPAQPGILDRECTVAFFDTLGGSPPTDCRYDGESIQERLGVLDRQSINVTVAANTTKSVDGTNVVCWDEDGRALAERGSGDCSGDVVLSAGGRPPESNDDAITAVRVASLSGEDVSIEVEVW
jgi:hypothetical protein